MRIILYAVLSSSTINVQTVVCFIQLAIITWPIWFSLVNCKNIGPIRYPRIVKDVYQTDHTMPLIMPNVPPVPILSVPQKDNIMPSKSSRQTGRWSRRDLPLPLMP